MGADPDVWARRASSFGSDAAAYAEHRPDYARAAVDWGLEARPVRDVLDLGAGTGALTGVLVDAGLAVTAVEPDAAMLAQLRARLPSVRAEIGAAEAIPLPVGSVDAVLAGQAFHWFRLERAMPEIARVLRLGGVLVVLANVDDPSVPWVQALNRAATTSASSPPPVPEEDVEPPPAHVLFTPWEQRRFAHTQRRTPASMTATIGTYSHTRVVSPEERTAALTRVRESLGANPETAGEFDRPLITVAARAYLRD